MATGRTFSFEEALEMGLIQYIYEKETFWEDVMAYASQFCPPNKASRAVGRIKRSVVTGMEIPFAEALGLERELQQFSYQRGCQRRPGGLCRKTRRKFQREVNS